MHGEIHFGRSQKQLILPFAHTLALPRCNAVFVHRQFRIGYDQQRINTQHGSKSFARGTGAHGIVERKQVWGRFFKRLAVRLKPAGKGGLAAVGVHQKSGSVSFKKRYLGGFRNAALCLFVQRARHQTVHHQTRILPRGSGPSLKIIQSANAVGRPQSGITLLEQQRCGHLQRAIARGQGTGEEQSISGHTRFHSLYNIHRGMPPNFRTGCRTVRSPNARKQNLEVIVNFRCGAHGRPRIPGGYFLLNGHRRRQSLDVVYVRLVQTPHKLPHVSAQAFHVPTLSLRIQRIEGQRGLARAAHAREHHQRPLGEGDVHVFQVVHASSLYFDDAVFHAKCKGTACAFV